MGWLLGFCAAVAAAVLAADSSCPNVADSTDPLYGGAIRQLRKDDGHEHNLYYSRDVWNADRTRMVAVYSDIDQKDWRVMLHDGEGCLLKELFPINRFDWRLAWDRKDPNILYTWRASNLYRFNVAEGASELLKSFAPLGLKPNGPSVNQAGDRILMITSDGAFHSYALPDMSDERSFQMEFPEGCQPAWDKPKYTGHRNHIFAQCSAPGGSNQAVLVYDDTGRRVHVFEGVGGGGHHDFSPDGKWAYFRLPSGSRNVAARSPLEIHVVNVDGTDDRVLYSIPAAEARYVHNLHLAWPAQVADWFIASFFPSTQNKPPAYAPPLDEIVQIRMDGTTRILARSETAYSTTGARTGGSQDGFWAQPLARPSGDGRRIVFNSNRSGTIDLCILRLEP